MTTPISEVESLASVSATFLKKIISSDAPLTKDDLAVARLATSALNNYTRALSVQMAHERTVVRLSEKLGQSPQQMQGYIAAALPDAGFVRALPAPETPNVPD